MNLNQKKDIMETYDKKLHLIHLVKTLTERLQGRFGAEAGVWVRISEKERQGCWPRGAHRRYRN